MINKSMLLSGLFFLLSILLLACQDDRPLSKYYEKLSGVWELEPRPPLNEPSPDQEQFTWGTSGIGNASVLIDLEAKVSSMVKQPRPYLAANGGWADIYNVTYKAPSEYLVSWYTDDERRQYGSFIIHKVKENEIWFELIKGSFSGNMFFGPSHPYYRWSGPVFHAH